MKELLPEHIGRVGRISLVGAALLSASERISPSLVSAQDLPSGHVLEIEENPTLEQGLANLDLSFNSLQPEIAGDLSSFEQRVQEEREYNPIYTQFLDAGGILIKAPESVSPRSLEVAQQIVDRMLSYRPDIRNRLAVNEASVVIIPKDSLLTDLPEFASFSGGTIPFLPGERVFDTLRGLGGSIHGRPTAVGEEDLIGTRLNYILEHEFAHTILEVGWGLGSQDEWRNIAVYKAFPSGIFYYSYAQASHLEFWAVTSQIYLGAINPNDRTASNGIVTREALREASPEAYEWLEKVYGPISGSWPYQNISS